MIKSTAPSSAPPALSELPQFIPVKAAAARVHMHADTFRKHFGYLIRRIGSQTHRVNVAELDAVMRQRTGT